MKKRKKKTEKPKITRDNGTSRKKKVVLFFFEKCTNGSRSNPRSTIFRITERECIKFISRHIFEAGNQLNNCFPLLVPVKFISRYETSTFDDSILQLDNIDAANQLTGCMGTIQKAMIVDKHLDIVCTIFRVSGSNSMSKTLSI